MSHTIRCHRCSGWIGESRRPMELVGIFKVPRDVEQLPPPRATWRCKACGWANVFEPSTAEADWRDVRTKRQAS